MWDPIARMEVGTTEGMETKMMVVQRLGYKEFQFKEKEMFKWVMCFVLVLFMSCAADAQDSVEPIPELESVVEVDVPCAVVCQPQKQYVCRSTCRPQPVRKIFRGTWKVVRYLGEPVYSTRLVPVRTRCR